MRGGSYRNTADRCRAAIRNRNEPTHRNRNRGFRPALPVAAEPAIPPLHVRPTPRRRPEAERDPEQPASADPPVGPPCPPVPASRGPAGLRPGSSPMRQLSGCFDKLVDPDLLEQSAIATIKAAQAEALDQEIEDDDQEAIALAVSMIDL